MIKNDSFIQSIHNTIDCISLVDAKRPNDRCWFTAKQIQDWTGMSKTTLWRKLDILISKGRLIDNSKIISNMVSFKNETHVPEQKLTDIMVISLTDESNTPHDTKIYNLNVLNHLAMIEYDNDKLNEIANKFSDILSEVETTGQYSVQKQDPSYMIEDPIERAKAWIREQEEKRALEAEKKALEEKNKDLQSTNDELVTEVEILLNSYVNTKQVYEMYLQNYPEAPNQAKSTMMGKIRKALCNICNERKTGRKIYKKHILNQKNEIEWRQEYFFDQDTKQILFDRVEDDLNYIVNIKLR